VLGLWRVVPKVMRVESLDLKHPAVMDAAESLRRVI
jgi:hypothetical protein